MNRPNKSLITYWLTDVFTRSVTYLQDYSVNFYLRQQWRDPRLRYTPPTKRLEVIKLEGDLWTKIWTPDTFFRNEKKASFHDITVSNRLLRLNYTGFLWYVTK